MNEKEYTELVSKIKADEILKTRIKNEINNQKTMFKIPLTTAIAITAVALVITGVVTQTMLKPETEQGPPLQSADVTESEDANPVDVLPVNEETVTENVISNVTDVTDVTDMTDMTDATYESDGKMLEHPPLNEFYISSGFGSYENHLGTDLSAPEGTDIYAVMDGTVTFSDLNANYGRCVIISHGDDITTLYAHCSELYVTEGQEVKAGDVIAAVGKTGLVTGPCLHFEYRINDEPINADDELAVFATDQTNTDDAPIIVPVTGERDLGGKSIVIGNWWQNSDDVPITTEYEQSRSEYRKQFMAENNFTIKESILCLWGEMQEHCASAILSGNPDAQIYALDPHFVMPLYEKGLFYPVNTLSAADFNESKWNRHVREIMTMGDNNTYGFAVGYEPRVGLFFNKRLFEEAGIDPNLPYDLQAADKWTWDAFTEICDKLAGNNIYAISSYSVDVMNAVLYSNNASYVKTDENGNYYTAVNEPEFLEALNFADGFAEKGYLMPQPDGSNWDWFVEAFNNGQAAMRIAEEYNNAVMSTNMTDDYGFVFFPKGPNGELKTYSRDNVLVIPSTYSQEEADDILFAYDLWTNDVPGYENYDEWKVNAYNNYKDIRAVDETLAMMYSGNYSKPMYHGYIPNLEQGELAYNIWSGYVLEELISVVDILWENDIIEANKYR